MASNRILPLAVLLTAAGLAGCTTPRLKPTPSQAVADARAHRNAAAAELSCTPLVSPTSIGFGFGESQVSELAVPALDRVGQQLGCHPQARVLVVGEADAHGTAENQRTLAQARIQTVVQELQRRGVAAGRIATQAEGVPPAGDEARLVILAEGRRW